MLNWIAPSIKVATLQCDLVSRNPASCEKKKNLYSEYGDNGGMMAYVAVHMMEAQNKLMEEIDQITVQTLICAGTEDKLCSISGTCINGTCINAGTVLLDLKLIDLLATEQAHSRMQNSTLKLYEGAYHNLAEELPETVEEYFSDLEEFISNILKSSTVTDNVSVISE